MALPTPEVDAAVDAIGDAQVGGPLAVIGLSYAGGSLLNRLTPAFAPEVVDYTVDVGLWIQSIQVTFELDDPSAIVTVAGQPTLPGIASSPVLLNLGMTEVLVVATADDGVDTVYVLHVVRAASAAQYAYAKSSNSETSDHVGFSVAMWGDTLAIGADGEDGNMLAGEADNSGTNSGAVYVFVKAGQAWVQQAYLKASNVHASSTPDASDRFGQSLALWDDTLAVGAYHEDGNPVNGPGDNTSTDSGAVYVFTRSKGTWAEQAYLKASNSETGDLFGYAVTLWGENLAVGAPGEASSVTGVCAAPSCQTYNDAPGSGAVYVFSRMGDAWTQEAYIKASNTEIDDVFGSAVALFDDTLAVGAYGEDSSGVGACGGCEADNGAQASGAVYMFVRAAGAWYQQEYLKASNTTITDNFGRSVALWGDSRTSCSRPSMTGSPWGGPPPRRGVRTC